MNVSCTLPRRGVPFPFPWTPEEEAEEAGVLGGAWILLFPSSPLPSPSPLPIFSFGSESWFLPSSGRAAEGFLPLASCLLPLFPSSHLSRLAAHQTTTVHTALAGERVQFHSGMHAVSPLITTDRGPCCALRSTRWRPGQTRELPLDLASSRPVSRQREARLLGALCFEPNHPDHADGQREEEPVLVVSSWLAIIRRLPC